jgi:formylglycine-generating enzyme required for sulfatase activity
MRAAGRLTTGEKYTLPTEAQWEYACRVGSNTSTRFSFGNDDSALSDYAWWGGILGDANVKNEQYAHKVGTRKPNGWGLHDMHGNVWEWCLDVYRDKLPGGTDPVVSSGGSIRPFRGGGWNGYAARCRSADRRRNAGSHQFNYLGFRAALCAVQSPAAVK